MMHARAACDRHILFYYAAAAAPWQGTHVVIRDAATVLITMFHVQSALSFVAALMLHLPFTKHRCLPV
jgi:hypothetical protein